MESRIHKATLFASEDALPLAKLAARAGLGKSSVISLDKLTVEIKGTEKMETLLIPGLDRSYIQLLLKEANRKLVHTKEKIERLKRLISSE